MFLEKGATACPDVPMISRSIRQSGKRFWAVKGRQAQFDRTGYRRRFLTGAYLMLGAIGACRWVRKFSNLRTFRIWSH